ncbi:hypothetical protein BgiBS90_015989 [Biomphalaria glabrata]|nr:hypothetical protein BgiBS90_015989 [Biomphalaria glabrata]
MMRLYFENGKIFRRSRSWRKRGDKMLQYEGLEERNRIGRHGQTKGRTEKHRHMERQSQKDGERKREKGTERQTEKTTERQG